MKKLFLIITFILLLSRSPALVSADNSSSAQLSSEIDYFISQQNASGYLVWLFSGDPKNYLENDKYSFYQGSPMCDVLKQKAASLPAGKFLGVNIHSLSNHSADIIDNNLSYLSKDCGTSVIRIWGSPDRGGPPAIKQVLDIAQKYGIKVIVVIADYSNSSGDILPGPIRSDPSNWYKTDYKSSYLPYALSMATTLKNHPALFGYELANEAHCSGITTCPPIYNIWANDVATQLKRTDPAAHVGIGQKANENTTLGDSPGPRDFYNSNTSTSIDITSGHYYNDPEKSLVLQAKEQSDQLSAKTFYIGEAGFVTNEVPSGKADTTPKGGPLTAGFTPLKYKCDEDTRDKPEFHPLRPYPGSPCDPLIPRSVPEAPLDPNLKYNTFACGTSLTPSTIERFNAYGHNGYYENLDLGYGYAHTICDPIDPDSSTGTTATCYRTEAFDITLDLSKTNLGILGNTQDNLTDAQKVNEYLSWYLTGTPQIGDQLPIDPNNPKDINRVINFSGPLRKLLPFDLQNTAKSTIVQSAGTDVHNYIVGCKKEVNLSYVLTAITNWFNLLKASVGFDFAFISHIPILINDVYDIVVSTPETAHKLSTILQSIEITDYFQIQKALTDGGFGQWASDLAVVGEKGVNWLHELGNLIDSLNLDVAVSCQTSSEFIRLKEQLLVKGYRPYPYPVGDLPPDPSAYTSFGEYWKKYNNWRGLTNVIFFGATNLPNPFVNESVWAQLFQNIPFSSMEDIAGEVTVSVFRDPTADQQTQNINDPVSRGSKSTAPLELIIKSAKFAK